MRESKKPIYYWAIVLGLVKTGDEDEDRNTPFAVELGCIFGDDNYRKLYRSKEMSIKLHMRTIVINDKREEYTNNKIKEEDKIRVVTIKRTISRKDRFKKPVIKNDDEQRELIHQINEEQNKRETREIDKKDQVIGGIDVKEDKTRVITIKRKVNRKDRFKTLVIRGDYKKESVGEK